MDTIYYKKAQNYFNPLVRDALDYNIEEEFRYRRPKHCLEKSFFTAHKPEAKL